MTIRRKVISLFHKPRADFEEGQAGFVVYRGNEVASGSGHYTLTAQVVNGTADLRKIPNKYILEGTWLEGGMEGMWRIELEE